MYWIEIHGGQLLSGTKLVQSCSVYKEEEMTPANNDLECYEITSSMFLLITYLERLTNITKDLHPVNINSFQDYNLRHHKYKEFPCQLTVTILLLVSSY